MKKTILGLSLISLLSSSLFATTYQYNASWAVAYAKNNVHKKYGNKRNQNPFTNYYYSGGNCTNFTSQVILAGLCKSANPKTVYANRLKFKDKKNNWFYDSNHPWTNGAVWRSALRFYKYMKKHNKTGMQFVYSSQGTDNKDYRFYNTKRGDIVALSDNKNSRVHHNMVVSYTKKTTCTWWDSFWGCQPKNKLWFTYQNGYDNDTQEAYPNMKNASFEESQNGTKYYRAYRPYKFIK